MSTLPKDKAKEGLGPPAAGSPYECTLAFHEECDLLRCEVRATILGLEHGIGTLKDLAAREKIRADAATKALLDYAEGNATPKEAPSEFSPVAKQGSVSALTGKEGQEAAAQAERLRAGMLRLLADGYGPGGGYYESDQRIGAAVALLQRGWGSGQPRAAPVNPSLPAGLKDLERAAGPRIVEQIKHVVCSACGWSDATVDVATGRSHCWRCGAEEEFTPEHVRRLIARRIAPQAPSAPAVPATQMGAAAPLADNGPWADGRTCVACGLPTFLRDATGRCGGCTRADRAAPAALTPDIPALRRKEEARGERVDRAGVGEGAREVDGDEAGAGRDDTQVGERGGTDGALLRSERGGEGPGSGQRAGNDRGDRGGRVPDRRPVGGEGATPPPSAPAVPATETKP